MAYGSGLPEGGCPDPIDLDHCRSLIKLIPFGFTSRDDVKERLGLDADSAAEYDAISDSVTQTNASKRLQLVDNIFDVLVVAKARPAKPGFDTPTPVRQKIAALIAAYNQ
jgi:hypothetical protein